MGPVLFSVGPKTRKLSSCIHEGTRIWNIRNVGGADYVLLMLSGSSSSIQYNIHFLLNFPYFAKTSDNQLSQLHLLINSMLT